MTAMATERILCNRSLPVRSRTGKAFVIVAMCLLLEPVLAAEPPAPSTAAGDVKVNGHLGDCHQCHGKLDSHRYMIDPARSQIVFRADNFGFGTAIGEFRRIEGGFFFDPAHREKVFAIATIRTDSVDFGDPLLNAVVRERFLNVDRFPTMTFAAKSIQETGAGAGKLLGDLTMFGVTKPVTLDVTFHKTGRHPLTGDNAAGFSATGLLKRSDFGQTLGLPSIGDDISFEIVLVGKNLD
jgi:polyisoprenoid-binding protein YceI